MGLFGIAEILSNLEKPSREVEVFETRTNQLLPSKQDWKDFRRYYEGLDPRVSGRLFPGAGGVLPSFFS